VIASKRLPGHHSMPLRLAEKRETFDQSQAAIDAGQACTQELSKLPLHLRNAS